jgi:hypothetical protein
MTMNNENPDYVKIVNDNLSKRFGINGDEGKIEEDMNMLMNEFKLEPRRAVQAVVQKWVEGNGMDFTPSVLDARYIAGNTKITVIGKITRQSATNSDKVVLLGTLGDECGTIDLLVNANAQTPDLKVGMVCRFEDVFTGEYKGNKQLVANALSKITVLDREMQVREFRKAEA